MGYDLHITRRKHWADKGLDIAAEEWLAYVQRDPDLRLAPENGPYVAVWRGAPDAPWLDWAEGQIYTKNPDAALIDKTVSIARRFDATVQGDDGEIYHGSSASPRPPKPSFGERATAWCARLRPWRPRNREHPPLGFGVGDTVCDAFGNEHTVLAIDPQAEHGLGAIRTRRRNDGSEHTHAMMAHGLTPLAKK